MPLLSVVHATTCAYPGSPTASSSSVRRAAFSYKERRCARNSPTELASSSSAFIALGAPGHFAAGDARFYAAADATAGHDADDRFVYNTSTGQLYYDADGQGGADAQLVATLTGAPTVAAADIWVI